MIKSKLSHSLPILFKGSTSNSISALAGLGALEPASWHQFSVEHPQRCSSLAYARTRTCPLQSLQAHILKVFADARRIYTKLNYEPHTACTQTRMCYLSLAQELMEPSNSVGCQISLCGLPSSISGALGPTSQQITSPPPTPRKHNQIPPKHHQQTEQQKAGARKNSIWASHWLVGLRTFQRQSLFLDYGFFPPETSAPGSLRTTGMYWAGFRGGAQC